MADKFKIKCLKEVKSEAEQKVISLRVSVKLMKAYSELAKKSGYSRNKLISMALEYAMKNIEMIE